MRSFLIAILLTTGCFAVEGIQLGLTCKDSNDCANNASGQETACINRMCLPKTMQTAAFTNASCKHPHYNPNVCGKGTHYTLRVQKTRTINRVTLWLDCWELQPKCKPKCPDCNMTGSDMTDPDGITRYDGKDCSDYYKDECE